MKTKIIFKHWFQILISYEVFYKSCFKNYNKILYCLTIFFIYKIILTINI